MDVRNLIKIYNEKFGSFSVFKNSFKENKLIIIPYSLIIISVIGLFFVYFYIDNITHKVWYLIGIILVYIISIVWSSYLQSKSIKRKHKNYNNYENHRLNEVDKFIKENFEIHTVKQYEILDTLIKKEIEILEDIKKYPFANTIRQLFVALFITGLLSYSFKELLDGDSQIGLSLLALYLMIFGTIIIIASGIYSLKDITKVYKLKQISKILSELQLRISKVESELEVKKSNTNKSFKNQSRKKRKRNKKNN